MNHFVIASLSGTKFDVYPNYNSLNKLAWFDILQLIAGLPLADAPKKISGVHKRCWRYIPNVVKALESSTNLTSSTDSGLKVETEASWCFLVTLGI